MEKDTKVTSVLFRVERSGDFKGSIFAIFPYERYKNERFVEGYAHIGQHFAGDYDFLMRSSREATEAEYKELKAELERFFGYNFRIIRRAHRRLMFKN